MGVRPGEILRQHLAKATAPASGRDPGGFPTDLDRGLLGPVELPGTLVEVMSGVALGFRLRGEPRVALLVDDLAASGSGDWHEGLNFAAVREVPMVLVVDQSGSGSGGVQASPPVTERASAYGFAGHAVPGADPREVQKVVEVAVEAARSGQGLQVVEVGPPHQDAAPWLLGTLVDAGELDASEADTMVRAATQEMEEALQEILAEPDPDPAVLHGFSRRAPNSAH
jgi:TPP-dependent pyruvate/acetoin dehydrogenase alpha subunit